MTHWVSQDLELRPDFATSSRYDVTAYDGGERLPGHRARRRDPALLSATRTP